MIWRLAVSPNFRDTFDAIAAWPVERAIAAYQLDLALEEATDEARRRANQPSKKGQG